MLGAVFALFIIVLVVEHPLHVLIDRFLLAHYGGNSTNARTTSPSDATRREWCDNCTALLRRVEALMKRYPPPPSSSPVASNAPQEHRTANGRGVSSPSSSLAHGNVEGGSATGSESLVAGGGGTKKSASARSPQTANKKDLIAGDVEQQQDVSSLNEVAVKTPVSSQPTDASYASEIVGKLCQAGADASCGSMVDHFRPLLMARVTSAWELNICASVCHPRRSWTEAALVNFVTWLGTPDGLRALDLTRQHAGAVLLTSLVFLLLVSTLRARVAVARRQQQLHRAITEIQSMNLTAYGGAFTTTASNEGERSRVHGSTSGGPTATAFTAAEQAARVNAAVATFLQNDHVDVARRVS